MADLDLSSAYMPVTFYPDPSELFAKSRYVTEYNYQAYIVNCLPMQQNFNKHEWKCKIRLRCLSKKDTIQPPTIISTIGLIVRFQ